MRRHLIDLRAELPGARGAGYDQRTGEVVLLVPSADAQTIRHRRDPRPRRAARRRSGAGRDQRAHRVEHGRGRRRHVEGINTPTGRRNRCTTGFVVTNGKPPRSRPPPIARTSSPMSTATERRPAAVDRLVGARLPGRADQPQSPDAAEPLFYADRGADRCGGSRPGATREARARATSSAIMAKARATAARGRADRLCAAGRRCAAARARRPGSRSKGRSCIPGDSGGPVFSGESRSASPRASTARHRAVQFLLLHVDGLSAAAVAAAGRWTVYCAAMKSPRF